MRESGTNRENLDEPKEIEVSPPKMSREISLSKCIIFGVFLGGCLGLFSSVTSIALLQVFNRPNIIIRPGDEGIHTLLFVFGGCLTGVLYGTFFRLIAKRATQQVLKLRVFLLTMLLAELVYIIRDYISITRMNVSYSEIADLLVFGGSLGIAYLSSRKPDRKNYL